MGHLAPIHDFQEEEEGKGEQKVCKARCILNMEGSMREREEESFLNKASLGLGKACDQKFV